MAFFSGARRMIFVRIMLVALTAAAAGVTVSMGGLPQATPEGDRSGVVEPDAKLLELIKRGAAPSGRSEAEWEEAHFAAVRAMRTMPSDKVLAQLVYFTAKEAKKPGADEEAGAGAAIIFKVLMAEQGPDP